MSTMLVQGGQPPAILKHSVVDALLENRPTTDSILEDLEPSIKKQLLQVAKSPGQ